MQLQVDGLITSCTPMVSIDLTLYFPLNPLGIIPPTQKPFLLECAFLLGRQCTYLPDSLPSLQPFCKTEPFQSLVPE